MNVVLFALVEENGKLGFSHQPGNFLGGRKGTGQQGGQSSGIKGMSKALPRD